MSYCDKTYSLFAQTVYIKSIGSFTLRRYNVDVIAANENLRNLFLDGKAYHVCQLGNVVGMNVTLTEAYDLIKALGG